jgi:hypothetical protein
MALPSISVTTQPTSHAIQYDEHTHQRVFIGPMPEKVVCHSEVQALEQKKRGLFRISTTQDEDDMDIIRDSTFKFFLHKGGRPEDWDEDQEHSIRQEMLQRWRNSEWGNVWGRRRREEHRAGSKNYWVGGSFEIGHFLGVDVLQVPSAVNRTSNLSTHGVSKPQHESHTGEEHRRSITTQGTFVPARSSLSVSHETSSDPSDFLPSASHLDIDNGTPYTNGGFSGESSVPATSSTTLLRPSLGRVHNELDATGPRSETIPLIVPFFPASADGQLHKGKGRLVHYADIPEQGASSPAPPSEVLARTGDAVGAGAAESPVPASLRVDSLDWGDVVMRGTLIVFFVFIPRY